jgi:transcriptional regulator with XRE-family HTH domain
MIRQETANTNELRPSKVLRQQAGVWLKALRVGCGLSQRQLAARVEVEYYTFISQIESGKGRVPAERLAEWADALEYDRAQFAKTLMKYYDPFTYGLVFGKEIADDSQIVKR